MFQIGGELRTDAPYRSFERFVLCASFEDVGCRTSARQGSILEEIAEYLHEVAFAGAEKPGDPDAGVLGGVVLGVYYRFENVAEVTLERGRQDVLAVRLVPPPVRL
jgi:hypothetical protein